MSSLKNKIVIVTGSSSRIALATTLILLGRVAKFFGIEISRFLRGICNNKVFAFCRGDLTKLNAADEAVAACN